MGLALIAYLCYLHDIRDVPWAYHASLSITGSSGLSHQVGHSARPLYEVLHRHGVALTAKSFAMGFRVEHPQALIDSMQYGETDAAGGWQIWQWEEVVWGGHSCELYV